MPKTRLMIFAILLLILGSRIGQATSPADKIKFDEWAKIKDPTTGPIQAIGTYTAGCLTGGVRLNLDGPGYALMRPSRNRSYSHPDMTHYLTSLIQRLQSAGSPLLLIGDVSPPRGGPMETGHNSHQIGLDADLWFMMSRTRPTAQERETWGAPSFVADRKVLLSSWSPVQTILVSTAADFSQVNRIFVSPPVKRFLCQTFPTAPWLYRIRPWWGHDAHLHVRLLCPITDPTCANQLPLNPKDNGCGADLDWWFSKEADDQYLKMITEPAERVFPPLPAHCNDVLTTP